MTRPSIYITIIRTLFGIVFIGGSFIHLYGGLFSPHSYAAFGDTAWPPLDLVWAGFVMPNIGWLAPGMAVFELAVGVGALLHAPWNRLAVITMACFFTFITVLGYAFPANGVLEDFLVNRAFSLVMIVLVLPWLLKAQHRSVPATWSALLHPTPNAPAAARIA